MVDEIKTEGVGCKPVILAKQKLFGVQRDGSEGKTPMQTLAMLSKVYGEYIMARTKIYEWHRRFKVGRESTKYNERIGQSSTSRNAENVTLVSECLRKDRR
ncbi:hypothetical protein TNCV_2487561 [Trichonephila clavipes]|uniref:Transposase n=1 Tax=Trichonephila clavipes TaxID=2585209 RepID=A0A8X7BB41_TRICX|nr:hypothetical protein TNCV_2487561 [Trichonephila clavipes]